MRKTNFSEYETYFNVLSNRRWTLQTMLIPAKFLGWRVFNWQVNDAPLKLSEFVRNHKKHNDSFMRAYLHSLVHNFLQALFLTLVLSQWTWGISGQPRAVYHNVHKNYYFLDHIFSMSDCCWLFRRTLFNNPLMILQLTSRNTQAWPAKLPEHICYTFIINFE